MQKKSKMARRGMGFLVFALGVAIFQIFVHLDEWNVAFRIIPICMGVAVAIIGLHMSFKN
jgi:hypothetical protein